MPTIIDVAKRAGVSFKTVSRVMNGEPSVRQSTRDKVLKAAHELNYKLNAAARTLRSKQPHHVVLVTDNPSRNYMYDVQLGAMIACQKAGYNLILESSFQSGDIDRLLNSTDLVGVILIHPLSNDLRLIERLIDAGIHFVRVGTELDVKGSLRICIDDYQAAYDLTQLLIDHGHTSIGFISGPLDHHLSQRRKDGFVHALMDAGIIPDENLYASGDFTYASGLKHAEGFITRSKTPTAIFASNDEMAAGCLAAAYKYNIQVPEDLSIVGFDDSPIATVVYPALTTIDQSTRDMTQKAVELLGAMQMKNSVNKAAIYVPHKLVCRASVAPCKQSHGTQDDE